jgi:hypothetical protein
MLDYVGGNIAEEIVRAGISLRVIFMVCAVGLGGCARPAGKNAAPGGSDAPGVSGSTSAPEDYDGLSTVEGEEVVLYGPEDVPGYSEEEEDSVIRTTDFPEGWPADIPMPDGFILLEGIQGTAEGGEGLQVRAIGDMSLSDVALFYEGIPGWTRDRCTAFNPDTDSSFMSTFTRGDGETLMVIGSDNGSGQTEIGLVYVVEFDDREIN